MKTLVLPGTLALNLIFASTPVLAQNLTEVSRQFDTGSASALPAVSHGFTTGAPIQAMVGVSPENFSSEQPWYLVQDQASLGFSEVPSVTRPWSLESQLRRNASPLLKLPGGASSRMLETNWIASRAPARELSFALSLLAAIYRADGAQAESAASDDLEFSLSIRHKIREAPDKLLEIVADEITANPEKVCEIVKASIKGSDGGSEVIASIVETASITKPDAMRLAAQCAVASVPESLQAVQEVLARLDPAAGSAGNDSKDAKGAKDCKDAKEAKGQIAPELPDPLDLPRYPRVPPIPPVPPPSTKTGFICKPPGKEPPHKGKPDKWLSDKKPTH